MRAAARPASSDAGDQRQAAQDQLRPSSASPTLATTKKIRLHVILLCSVHRQPCWAGRMAAGLRAVARAQWGVCGRAGVSDDCAAAAHSRKRCVAIPPRGVCRPPRGLSALHHFPGTKDCMGSAVPSRLRLVRTSRDPPTPDLRPQGWNPTGGKKCLGKGSADHELMVARGEVAIKRSLEEVDLGASWDHFGHLVGGRGTPPYAEPQHAHTHPAVHECVWPSAPFGH